MNAGLNTLERDDLLRKIAWSNARIDKIERMLKGEQVGTARIADAAITNAKIKDLTWDKAQGGTATLGGLNNVDGILSILDNANVEKVVLDKDGVLVKGGKIVIQNDGNEVSIDSKGIVGVNNFATGTVSSGVLNQSFTADADVTDSEFDIVIPRTQLVLISFHVSGGTLNTSTSYADFQVGLYIDGSNYEALDFQSIPDNDWSARSESGHFLTVFGAGTYTIKLRGTLTNVVGASPYAFIYRYRMSVIIFGT